jgi:hypothetical protein
MDKNVEMLTINLKLQLNPKMKILFIHSFVEENKIFDSDLYDESITDQIILYLRSYIEKTNVLSKNKEYDYNFVGSLFFSEVYSARKWILEYAKEKFTKESYFA